MSKRKLASLGGKAFSTITSKTKPIKKKPRSEAEASRIYGPKMRRAWVKSLPCAVCGVEGYSENAHVGHKNAGMGHKADADQIAPLCGPHYLIGGVEQHYEGCHARLHRIGVRSFEEMFGVDLSEKCEETQRQWLSQLQHGT